jgi:hypothetical protein
MRLATSANGGMHRERRVEQLHQQAVRASRSHIAASCGRSEFRQDSSHWTQSRLSKTPHTGCSWMFSVRAEKTLV